MNAMMDATCPQCTRRIGWAGAVTDRPPCPRCGHQVPLEELQAEDAKMREFLRLYALHPKDATPAELIAQRRLSGLSRTQAAKQVGVPISTLMYWENGGTRPTPEECVRLSETYGCG